MVNILFPTDFSALSRVALDFAIAVANKLDAKITLLHVVTVAQPTRASVRFRLEALEDELMRTAREDMESLLGEIKDKVTTSHPLAYDVVRSATFETTVKNEAKKLQSDLIVMGSHGASGLKKVVIGSSATAVIEISNIPVFVVPEEATFKGFKNLIYATDLKHLDSEIKTLLPYVKIFGATVHILHVTQDEATVATEEEKIRTAIASADYTDFAIKVIAAKDTGKAVEDYFKEVQGDLLATFTHTHSVYERLFGGSLTRSMAFHSELPLLTFRQSEEVA